MEYNHVECSFLAGSGVAGNDKWRGLQQAMATGLLSQRVTLNFLTACGPWPAKHLMRKVRGRTALTKPTEGDSGTLSA